MRALSIAGFALLMVAAPIARAAPPAGSDAVEELDDVAEVKAPDVAKPPDTVDLIGRLHPALVHLPIGWLLMTFLLDLGAFVLRRRLPLEWGPWALGMTLLAFLPAAATGLLRAPAIVGSEAATSMVATHRNLMLATFGVALVAFVLRIARRNRLEGAFRPVYLAVMVVAVVLLAAGADFGGRLVYGPDYLPF